MWKWTTIVALVMEHALVRGRASCMEPRVFDGVVVGKECIIAGELVDRTVVEDWVRFQGETAHGHTDVTGNWDATVEPSPVTQAVQCCRGWGDRDWRNHSRAALVRGGRGARHMRCAS